MTDLAARFACSPYGRDAEEDVTWASANGFACSVFMTDAGRNGLREWPDDRVAALRALCARTSTRVGLHTLSAVNAAEFVPFMSEAVDQYLDANIDLAAKLRADVIVHAGIQFGDRIDMRVAASIEHFTRAVRRAERAEVTLLLENMNRGPAEAEPHYIGETSAELRPFFDAIRSPNLKWAFSANHAHLAPEDWSGFLDALGTSRLGIVMMADCHGTTEEHLAPGQGNLDFGALIRRIEREGYDGMYFLTFGPRPALLAGRQHILDRVRA